MATESAMKSILDDDRAVLFHGDASDLGQVLDENTVDAIVTDPPAGIGFMGKGWDDDKGGRDQWVAWLAKTLAPSFRALKPGGHALVWALPRTSHWTAWALELVGFDVRDRVSHLTGTGFPKSLNLSKAIDAHLGKSDERAVLGTRPGAGNKTFAGEENGKGLGPVVTITSAATAAAAAAWEGYGTALKPACEDWWLVRKPLEGTYAENVLKWGVGGLNIDGCRIGTNGEVVHVVQSDPANRRGNQAVQPGSISDVEKMQTSQRASIERTNTLGRWPAHLTLDEEAAAMLDEQSGVLKSGAGGASRFFYVAKAARSEKDAGLGHLPEKSGGEATDREDGSAGTNSPRAGAGRTGGVRNFHPTVKNLALMRWLVRMITPPGGIVLDPFSGSGSTGIAALSEGFNFIGCEKGDEYIPILLGRIQHALGNTGHVQNG